MFISFSLSKLHVKYLSCFTYYKVATYMYGQNCCMAVVKSSESQWISHVTGIRAPVRCGDNEIMHTVMMR